MISCPILLLFLLLGSLQALRLHSQTTSQAKPQTPSDLTGLSQEEEIVRSKLSLINLQIAAVNNTIAKNLYLPNWEAGTTTLIDANGDQLFDPK